MFNRLNKIFLFCVILSALNYAGSNSIIKNERAPVYSSNASSQYTIEYQSNPGEDFYKFISGVNSIYVLTDEGLSPGQIKDQTFYSKYRNLLISYLKGLGFENIAISSAEQSLLDETVSLTHTATFKIKLDCTDDYISNVSFSFFTCNHDEFRFSKNVDYYLSNDWNEFLFSEFKSIYWFSVPYNESNSLTLNSISTEWTEKKLQDYLNKYSLSKLEGIYEKFGSVFQYKIGIVKENDDYKIIYLSGSKNNIDWKEGDLKGIIHETSSKNMYKVEWVMSDKSFNRAVYLSVENEHFINFNFSDPAIGTISRYLKLYPVFSPEHSVSKAGPSTSGTGFVVSTDGLILTAHHVIENGKDVSVQFDQGDTLRTYKTKVLLDDKDHDLSILYIDDDSFKPFNNIPYKICPAEEEIGTDVFTLGYPLIEVLGESVKLYNGIISSETGYLNDKQSYQVSIPVQPGSSGGPLFNKSGNVIGVVNAKFSSADNIAFAIKCSPVINLLKKLPASSSVTTGFSSKSQPLPEIVKSYKKYVCLIKVD